MTRHIHLDPVGGIAGDMFVAAMLSAFPHLAPRVMADLAAVLPDGLTAELTAGKSLALAANRFAINGEAATPRIAHFPDLVARINGAALSDGTADAAVAILTRLAESEAEVHAVPLAHVHFHEIADWDSLGDVVAAGSLIAALPGTTWSASPLPLGGGQVKTSHGPLPVPAPATTLLLKGFAFRDDGVPGERVTPTGAAILAHLAPADRRGGTLSATGLGAGTRDLPGIANVLRVLVFAAGGAVADDTVAVLAFAVDDMTGEEIATAAERLRAEPGVRDLTITPRLGKKGRPEHLFELLVDPAARERVADACFDETATIGLRWRHEARLVLPRTAVDGEIRRKDTLRPDGTTTAKAESDDLTGASLAARRAAKAKAEGPR
ncbi:LarC family nickel insertion protein [Acuticoccus sp. MNP-M23]|uniref:LarC family nickel insertion protein n=1 Tax=Acuticoccus sp. MNP-M23 TaxID=3072793 RepID=UPI0028152870|nr:LarC family nickel insertion protein [Acuticoccus sp. MNP-M23]WMS43418.1 LarC family nickel insertion protein [Acuticoccus sp. MNP-M23]